MNKKIQSIILISILALGGCATGGFSPDVVSRDAAGKSQYVQSGTIVSIKKVTIEGDRDSGNIFGSILGAIVGSNIGGEEDETTQEIGAVVGTAVGSVVGQEVSEGEVILILEAMKMQNEVTAPVSGKISSINCSEGENVEANMALVVITPNTEEGENIDES